MTRPHPELPPSLLAAAGWPLPHLPADEVAEALTRRRTKDAGGPEVVVRRVTNRDVAGSSSPPGSVS